MRKNLGVTQIVPMVLTVVILFALLFIGAFVNGVIENEIEDQYPSTAGDRTMIQNQTLTRLNNSSNNFNAALDIVQVVVIITILAAAIGAIFMFTRFRT